MYQVILVHGTFSPNAQWTKAGSDFEAAIKSQLSIRAEDISRFIWSGKNSHASRLKAAQELADCLENSLKINHNKRHVIISHSHGGNIALYALKKLDKPPNDLALVTLSTPFLNCSLIDFAFFQTVIRRIFTFAALFYSASYFVSNDNLDNGWELLYIFLIISFAYHSVDWFFETADKYAKNFANKIDITAIPNIKLLVVSFKGDEAIGWLKGIPFIEKLFKWFSPIGSALGFWGIIVSTILFTLILGIMWLAANGSELIQSSGNVASKSVSIENPLVYFLMGFPLILFIASIVLVFALIPITMIMRSNPFFFGWESVSNYFTLEIFATRQPPVRFDYRQKIFDRKIRQNHAPWDLIHSEPYANSIVIEYMCNWISSGDIF